MNSGSWIGKELYAIIHIIYYMYTKIINILM